MKIVLAMLVALAISSRLMANTPTGGLIDQQTWTAAGSPYIVTNDVTINNLIIQPGVAVLFSSNYVFNVTGLLNAVGTSNKPISFNAINPGSGWQGILFTSASTNSQFQFCILQGANNSGIRLRGTPLAIQNCIITNNTANYGGGINTDGSLILQSCQVSGNSVYSGGGTASGGGIYSSGGANTIIALDQCSVNNNSISAVTAMGAGVECENGILIMTDSIFSGNAATGNQCSDFPCHNYSFGGAIYTGGSILGQGVQILGNSVDSGDTANGAGIYVNGSITLTNCDISENAGYSQYGGAVGGGIYSQGVLQLQDCRIAGNSVIFIGCCAGPSYYGAAIYSANSANNVIENCIVAYNDAGTANGIYFGPAIWFQNSSGLATILNCVFYDNYNFGGDNVFQGGSGTVENCIFFANSVGTTGLSLNYNLVPGGYAGTGNMDDSTIPVNSVFTDTTFFFLTNSSPAIDAGDPNPSFNDVNFPPSEGGPRNDMGAYGGPDATINLVFLPSLNITSQPTSQIVNFGTTVTFSVSIDGGIGPSSYQWQFNETNIIGGTNSTLTLPNVTLQQAGYYQAVVSNLVDTISSASASLTVTRIRTYIGLTISGIVGDDYQIQYTTNLNNQTWTTLTNIVLSSSPYIFFDADSADSPGRYYRFILTQ